MQPATFFRVYKGCPRPRVTIHNSLASLRSVLSNTTQHISRKTTHCRLFENASAGRSYARYLDTISCIHNLRRVVPFRQVITTTCRRTKFSFVLVQPPIFVTWTILPLFYACQFPSNISKALPILSLNTATKLATISCPRPLGQGIIIPFTSVY